MADEETYRFRLKTGDGTLVAESPRFSDINAVVAGISAVRESAATGHIVDGRVTVGCR